MTFDAYALLALGFAAFVVAWLLYTLHLLGSDPYLGRLATGTLSVGVVMWTAGVLWRATLLGGMAGRLCDICVLLVLLLTLGALLAEKLYRTRAFSPWSLAVAAPVAGYTVVTLPYQVEALQAVPAVYRDARFQAYLVVVLSAYASLLLAGLMASVTIFYHPLRLRFAGYASLSVESLERTSLQVVRWALIVLAAGLALGMWWSWVASGLYWHWLAAETWVLIVWLVYAALLHIGRFRRWPLAFTVGMVLVGFAVTTLAF